MSWLKFAWWTLALLTVVVFASPWVSGIELDAWPDSLRWALLVPFVSAMIIIGRDERRREKEEDTWVDDPRRTKLQNWLEKRRERFSPKRGLEFFIIGLVVFTIMIGIAFVTGSHGSVVGAITFVLGMSLLAGLFGMFTEKVPL